jgi:predicted SpoU family rRNA methylase
MTDNKMVKVKQSRYRPEQDQRVDRGIALPFRGLGARRGCVFSTTPRSLYPEKDPVPIVQEA